MDSDCTTCCPTTYGLLGAWLQLAVYGGVSGRNPLLGSPESPPLPVRHNVLFGMDLLLVDSPIEHTNCPDWTGDKGFGGGGFDIVGFNLGGGGEGGGGGARNKGWNSFGRDAELTRILAAHTGQLGGCWDVGLFAGNCTYPRHYCSLLNDAIDFYGSGMNPRPERLKQVDFLYPHARDDLCVMVRRAGWVRRNIVDAFEPPVWAVTLLFYAIFTAALWGGWSARWGDAWLETAQALVTGAYATRSRRLMVWCTALGLVLLNAFSGIFTSYFSVPRRGAELNTLDEVDRAVDKVVAMPRVVADFKDVDISSVRLLAKLSEFKFDTEEILSGRAAVMDTESTLEAVRRMNEVLQDGASPLRTVPECVVSPAYLSFPVRKGWPLVHRYSALVQRLVEGGVVQRLTREGLRNFSVSLELPGFVDVALADNPKPLVLIHFLEAYILLASGLMAATAAFLGEAMHATLMKRRKKLQQQDDRLKETQPSQADPDEGNDMKKSEKYLADSVVHNEDNDGTEEDCIVHLDLEEDDGKTDSKERDVEERNKEYTLETEQDIANVEKENKDCLESGFNEITTTVVLYVDKECDVEELKVLGTEQVTPNNGRELIGSPESEFNEVTTDMVLNLLADNKIECQTTERIERGYEK